MERTLRRHMAFFSAAVFANNFNIAMAETQGILV
jgi:hypothetical protein